jgi:hypothetical protein
MVERQKWKFPGKNGVIRVAGKQGFANAALSQLS